MMIAITGFVLTTTVVTIVHTLKISALEKRITELEGIIRQATRKS